MDRSSGLRSGGVASALATLLLAMLTVLGGQPPAGAAEPELGCASLYSYDSCALVHAGDTYTMTVSLKVDPGRVCADQDDDHCLDTLDVLVKKLASKPIIDSCDTAWSEKNDGSNGMSAYLWEAPGIPESLRCTLSWSDTEDPRLSLGVAGAEDAVLTAANLCNDDCPNDPSHLIVVSSGLTVDSSGDAPLADASSTSCVTADGNCTLRAAIAAANNRGGHVEIDFKIPGDGIPIISPASALPTVTGAGTTIDGSTQPIGGVRIDGARAGNVKGLDIYGADVTVRGLLITGFAVDAAVQVEATASHATIVDDVFGLPDPNTYTVQAPNLIGIRVQGASGTRIGGATNGDGVISSGNTFGIQVIHATNTTIVASMIGTDVTGQHVIRNSRNAVMVDGSSHTIIGGSTSQPGQRPGNILIGGSTDHETSAPAVWLTGSSSAPTTDTTIAGNLVDLTTTGDVDGAGSYGIALTGTVRDTTIGGPSSGLRNLVSGASTAQVILQGRSVSNTTVESNWLGLDPTGKQATAFPVNSIGVADVGSVKATIGSPEHGNVINLNRGTGIQLMPTASGKSTSKTTVAGNTVGLNADGSHGSVAQAMRAGIDDVLGSKDRIGPDNTAAWSWVGVGLWDTDEVSVTGNSIGTTIDGSASLPNGVGVLLAGTTRSTIGGAGRAGNLVSVGNVGIAVQDLDQTDGPTLPSGDKPPVRPDSGTTILGNLVGTTGAGTQVLAPADTFPDQSDKPAAGITVADKVKKLTIGDTSHGNVVAGSELDGVLIDGATAGVDVIGNRIGVGLANTPLAIHLGIGVAHAADVTIGGRSKGAGNVIAHGVVGIHVTSASTSVAMLGNSIYAHSQEGIEAAKGTGAAKVGHATIRDVDLAHGKLRLTVKVPTAKGHTYTVQAFVNGSCSGTDAHAARKHLSPDVGFTATSAAQTVTMSVASASAGPTSGVTVLITDGTTTGTLSKCVGTR